MVRRPGKVLKKNSRDTIFLNNKDRKEWLSTVHRGMCSKMFSKALF